MTSMNPKPYKWTGYTTKAKKAECFLTPWWAVDAILNVELMTRRVIDPCCGEGIMSEVASEHGYTDIASSDKYDWGFGEWGVDFLGGLPYSVRGHTILMNPPFSLATQFIERARELGARKIICFQRFAWWESQGREEFWANNRPNRIHVCADRASCKRIDISPEEWKGMGGTSTAHAWFVWEEGQPTGPILGRLLRKKG